MKFTTFRDALAESIGGLEAEDLTPETALGSLAAWDSLAILTTMEVADADFGAPVISAEVRACRTLGELHSLVAARVPVRP